MFRRLVMWCIGLTIIVLAACAPHEYTATVLDNPRPIENFTLTAHTGEQVSLNDSAGQWRVIYFGFTHCPDVCPTTMFEMRRVSEALDQQAEEVQFYMISVDPKRDSADTLGQYVTNFHPDFVGLRTEDPEQLAAVAQEFGIYYELSEPSGDDPTVYDVAHTASMLVVDPEGNLAAVIPDGTPADAITADLRALMKGQ